MNKPLLPREGGGSGSGLPARISTAPTHFRVFFLFLSITLLSCGPAPRKPELAFYHWQTQLALTASETGYLDSLGCHRLYLKLLDIAREPASGEIQPYSLLEVLDTAGLSGKTLVPCVFLTNSVFQGISVEKTDWLVRKTAGALLDVGRPLARFGFSEIQFDCDWTPSTRTAYFSFLKKIKQALPRGLVLSATIRLHQYKFPEQTGVPPVERGMLMLYNTGDIDRWEEQNSIFQPEAARKYLLGAPPRYPLPLDLALPVFSWALVYRDDELWKIIPGPDPAEFRDTLRFGPLESAKSPRFRIQKNTFLAGYYLRRGDLIRVEELGSAALRRAAELASGIVLAPDARLAFYHLDTGTARRYPVKELKALPELIHSGR